MDILLVEDSVMIGDAIKDYLIAKGHSIYWCTTIADANIAIAENAYGLVLLDLQLPDGNGLSILKRLRQRENEVPVIVLTTRDQISDQIASLGSGATDYLRKPFNLGELSHRIDLVA